MALAPQIGVFTALPLPGICGYGQPLVYFFFFEPEAVLGLVQVVSHHCTTAPCNAFTSSSSCYVLFPPYPFSHLASQFPVLVG